ncbi:hypothetical protein Vretimale_9154 [Volvox reticuliferus]|uniref:Uncharacterized protein n=1 Tax=Volvox reticuliferus TaxID=1737510 RepID=A0A8J4GCS4_9CHLO|nr:hypothetical protein Vretimale_9154 [Volvox reticuliferus]
MMDAWEETGVQPPELPQGSSGSSVSSNVPPLRLTRTMLRQRLRPALNAYYHMLGLTADYPETLSQWPSGSANGCPCCGDSHCSYRSPAPASTAVAAGGATYNATGSHRRSCGGRGDTSKHRYGRHSDCMGCGR